jgi:hypothetical protein
MYVVEPIVTAEESERGWGNCPDDDAEGKRTQVTRFAGRGEGLSPSHGRGRPATEDHRVPPDECPGGVVEAGTE